MNLRVAIVDDTEADRTRLAADVRSALAAKGVACTCSLYASAEDMLAVFAEGATDLAFLDVCMEGLDGIELADRMRAKDRALVIVFVTTSREHALDAYRTHPFDYLVKPYDQERLHGLLDDVLASIAAEDPVLELGVPYGSMPVPVRRIVVIEARDHDTLVTLEDGEEMRSTTSYSDVRALAEENPTFLEVNRGVMVNMDHVVAVEGTTLSMEGGKVLPLRKRDRAALSRAITRHMVSRMGRRRG